MTILSSMYENGVDGLKAANNLSYGFILPIIFIN